MRIARGDVEDGIFMVAPVFRLNDVNGVNLEVESIAGTQRHTDGHGQVIAHGKQRDRLVGTGHLPKVRHKDSIRSCTLVGNEGNSATIVNDGLQLFRGSKLGDDLHTPVFAQSGGPLPDERIVERACQSMHPKAHQRGEEPQQFPIASMWPKEDGGTFANHQLGTGPRVTQVNMALPGFFSHHAWQLKRINHVGAEHVAHAGFGKLHALFVRQVGKRTTHIAGGTRHAFRIEPRPDVRYRFSGAQVLLRRKDTKQPRERSRCQVLQQIDAYLDWPRAFAPGFGHSARSAPLVGQDLHAVPVEHRNARGLRFVEERLVRLERLLLVEVRGVLTLVGVG